MKFLQTLKKYLFVFVGALLFGLAAVKLKSARRAENKANEKVREQFRGNINSTSEEIEDRMHSANRAKLLADKRREDALKKLDQISENSGSVGALLDEYNRKRV